MPVGNHSTLVGVAGVALAVVLIVWGNLLAFVVDTKVTDKGIAIVLFRLVRICTVPYENICLVEPAGFGFPKLFAYNLKTRPLEKKYYLELKKGWFARKLLISPAASEMFPDKLRERGIVLGTRR